jgi:2-keto-4-pentenoate hydratase/2-oxohepta-3-ene-1,7-dioic acid hydratase in catechol pathway
MRVVNADHRLALVVDGTVVDVERASRGQFTAEVQGIYERWDEFRDWAGGAAARRGSGPRLSDARLSAPVPSPRQVFAIGLNYREHAEEGGLGLPDTPMVFTKFPSSITGPYEEIELPAGSVDYEAELVVVIGRRARHVDRARAWDHVAGLTVGQDLSERQLQIKPPAPQYSLAKSFPGFGPIGPALVTPDELADADDLEIGCLVNGEQLQKARTSDLIFSVPVLVEYLSGVLPLLPGDLIFTGTPSGVGFVREPQRLLGPGDQLVTYIEGIGEMSHCFSGSGGHRG